MIQKEIHPLVRQLKFTRSEWLRAFDKLSIEDGKKTISPINSLSWMIGHLAWHEKFYWLDIAQKNNIMSELDDLVGYGCAPCSPPLIDMWVVWYTVTILSDNFLEKLKTEELYREISFKWKGETVKDNFGTMMYRLIYHYWYHIGESQALRQTLGHKELPEFVGDIRRNAPFCWERI